VLLLSCVLALAVPAATAAPPPPTAFHVTIQATLDIQADYPRAGGSCSEHLSRHVEVRNAKPLTLTATQLGKAKNDLFELVATETRADTYTAGCDEGGTSTCGTVSYKIGSVGTGVGFLNRATDRFVFFYTRISTDPYQGQCGAHLWGAEEAPGSTGKVWIDNFPPTTLGRPQGATVARDHLTANRRFVVNWSATDHVALGSPLPVQADRSVSWQVTLVPR